MPGLLKDAQADRRENQGAQDTDDDDSRFHGLLHGVRGKLFQCAFARTR
jgi:hypothetical protein